MTDPHFSKGKIMQEITKYRATDGSEWNKPKDALAREEMIAAVDEAMSHLKPTPDDNGFSNGTGFIQQNARDVRLCKEALLAIAKQEGVLKWWIDQQRTDFGKTGDDFLECHPSWFSRMLDGSHRPLEHAYNRLYCIDDQLREWGQPYYALHPDEGEQFEILLSSKALQAEG